MISRQAILRRIVIRSIKYKRLSFQNCGERWLSSRATLPSIQSSQQPIIKERQSGSKTEQNIKPSEIISDMDKSSSDLKTDQPQLRQIKDRILNAAQIYAELSKLRLASLVVLTTMAGYTLSPAVCHIHELSHSPTALLFATAIGTSLCVTSANTINQLMEIKYDSQMKRTRHRVLCTGKVSSRTAAILAGVSGVGGTALLYHAVNPISALLGFGNIILYTCAYTPAKRSTIWNTHIGALVGGIPPLIGWFATLPYPLSMIPTAHVYDQLYGGMFLAGILLAWQFPHFNSLSYNIRKEYLSTGYKMLANHNPLLNSIISLRWSVAMVPLSAGLVVSGVTTPLFMLTSMLPNSYLIYHAWQFYRSFSSYNNSSSSSSNDYFNSSQYQQYEKNSSKQQDSREKSARGLFIASLFHLPAIIVLMMVHKKHWYKDATSRPYDDLCKIPFPSSQLNTSTI